MKIKEESEEDEFDFLNDDLGIGNKNKEKEIELVWRGMSNQIFEQEWGFFKVNSRKDYEKIFEDFKLENFLELVLH